MGTLALDIFPFDLGNRWFYKVDCGLFSLDARMEVMDRATGYYLLRFTAGNMEVSVVLKSDVDLSVVAYSNKGIKSLEDEGDLKQTQKIELLRSPVLTGTAWENILGRFTIEDSQCTFKMGNKTYEKCIHLHLVDTSNSPNDFYFMEGVGLLYASLYIDNLGEVIIRLKRFN